MYKEVEEIIYFGDLLFPLGDVINRNYDLFKSAYVEEWWELELKKKLEVTGESPNIDKYNVSLDEAVGISERYFVPLHPKYIFYWTQIKKEDFFWLLDWLQNAVWRSEKKEKLLLPYSKSVKEKFKEAKRALEILGVEHDVVFDNVIVNEARALMVNLGLEGIDGSRFKEKVRKIIEKYKDKGDVLEIVNCVSKYVVKDKVGCFIGTRMGRPEKAKLRKLTGSPSVLFPIGEQGGRFRSVNAAVEKGHIRAEFPVYKCECGNETIYRICEKCGKETKKMFYCYECGKILEARCEKHETGTPFSRRNIDSKYFFNKAIEHLGISKSEVPELIKGVRGTSSEEHDFENLAKGILRSKHNLCVNKDGTIRYDATEIPVTHFKPKEIGTSIEKLKKIGYEKDIYGEPIENEEQILDLMPHDIIFPACPDTKDEKADDVFFNIANFVDELLEKFYKLPRYYNLKSKEELIGHLVVCMAPHNCAGVIGRIIGFSKIQGLMASPYIHAAVRRDCDGDEAALMMLMDVLLNFSRKFLPAHRGGTQDAPLVLNARIRAGEVDSEVLDFETCSNYPLEMYEMSEKGAHSSEIENKIETIGTRLRGGKSLFTGIGFTHDSSDFNAGVVNSAYKVLPTMKDKVENQMDLVKKLRSVNTEDVARLIIDRHFIRDIRGNLRKFSHQQFRCVKCNEKFRRPPLVGVCTKCGGKIIFTISHGGIIKYLEPAISLAESFDISDYTKQALELAKLYVESIFGKESEKQETIEKWF